MSIAYRCVSEKVAVRVDCGPLRSQSAKFLYDQDGVLKVTLHQSGFDYEYVQTTNGIDATVADSGMGVPANP